MEPLNITGYTKSDGAYISEYRKLIAETSSEDTRLTNLRITTTQINVYSLETIYEIVIQKVQKQYEEQGMCTVAEDNIADLEQKFIKIFDIYARVINEMDIGTVFQRSILAILARQYSSYRENFMNTAASYRDTYQKFLTELKKSWRNQMFSLAKTETSVDEFLKTHQVYLSSETKGYHADRLRRREVILDAAFRITEKKFCFGAITPEVTSALNILVHNMKKEYSNLFASNALVMHEATVSLYENLKKAAPRTYSVREYAELQELLEALTNLRESPIYDTCFMKDTDQYHEYEKLFAEATATLRMFAHNANEYFIEHLRATEPRLAGLPFLAGSIEINALICNRYMEKVLTRLDEFAFPLNTKVYICKTIREHKDMQLETMCQTAANFERMSRNYLKSACENAFKDLADVKCSDTDRIKMLMDHLERAGILVGVDKAEGYFMCSAELVACVRVANLNPDFTIENYVSANPSMRIFDDSFWEIIKKTYTDLQDLSATIA